MKRKPNTYSDRKVTIRVSEFESTIFQMFNFTLRSQESFILGEKEEDPLVLILS